MISQYMTFRSTVGCRVKINWDGSTTLPKTLHDTWATIIDITPYGNYKVRCDRNENEIRVLTRKQVSILERKVKDRLYEKI